MAEVQGTCDARFEGVRRASRPASTRERDVGASVAVYLRGRAGGRYLGRLRRRGQERPVGTRHHHQRVVDHQDDDVPLCAHAGGQGQLDFHAPVATYWPEFAAGRQGARSRCGTSWGTPPAFRAGTCRSTAGAAGRLGVLHIGLLAAQKPWWEPGTASGYHALTQGYLIGEVVRRITGRVDRRLLRRRGGQAAWRPTSSSGCPRARTAGSPM